MKRSPFHVELSLAYCAWTQLAPATIARYTPPALLPWFHCYLEAARAAVARDGDRPGEAVRRAIIRGATPEQPFPGPVRGRAIEVGEMVRTMSIDRLLEIGALADVCHMLGCETKARTKEPAWQRDLARGTAA